MDFAKNLLKKYGWQEGQGLGKNSDGIIKPLRANLKFDSSGLGLDKAKEFKNHWWERVFNDAANNIQINKSEKSVDIAVKNEDFVEISTSEYSTSKLKEGNTKDGYNHFIKKSVLSGLHEKPEEGITDDLEHIEDQISNHKILTDEELFVACGGRTAHKGARHGLTLSGKLSRIAEQERELLKKMQENAAIIEDTEWKVITSKKKNKKKAVENENLDLQDLQCELFTTEYHIKSKKKRKKEMQLDEDLSSAINYFCLEENFQEKVENAKTDLGHIKKKKRRKKDVQEANENINNHLENNEFEIEEMPTRKRKRKELKHVEEIKGCEPTTAEFLKSDQPKEEKITKKKKKKLQRYVKNMAVDLEASLSLVGTD